MTAACLLCWQAVGVPSLWTVAVVEIAATLALLLIAVALINETEVLYGD